MARLSFGELGMSLRMQAALGDALRRKRRGLLLLTGPPGSGVSSTLNSLLFDFNPYPGPASGAPLDSESPSGPPPRISILEGFGRAGDAAELRLRLSRGEVVFVTLPCESVVHALRALLAFGVEAPELRASLRGCLNQRLVPRPCPECSLPVWGVTRLGSEFAPMVERLNLRAKENGDLSFLHSRGCAHCRNTGTRGRIAIFEWMDPVCLDEPKPEASAEAWLSQFEMQSRSFPCSHGSGAYISFGEDLREKIADRKIAIETGMRCVEPVNS